MLKTGTAVKPVTIVRLVLSPWASSSSMRRVRGARIQMARFAFDHLPAVLFVPLAEGHHVDVVEQLGALLRSFLELQQSEQTVIGRPTA